MTKHTGPVLHRDYNSTVNFLSSLYGTDLFGLNIGQINSLSELYEQNPLAKSSILKFNGLRGKIIKPISLEDQLSVSEVDFKHFVDNSNGLYDFLEILESEYDHELTNNCGTSNLMSYSKLSDLIKPKNSKIVFSILGYLHNLNRTGHDFTVDPFVIISSLDSHLREFEPVKDKYYDLLIELKIEKQHKNLELPEYKKVLQFDGKSKNINLFFDQITSLGYIVNRCVNVFENVCEVLDPKYLSLLNVLNQTNFDLSTTKTPSRFTNSAFRFLKYMGDIDGFENFLTKLSDYSFVDTNYAFDGLNITSFENMNFEKTIEFCEIAKSLNSKPISFKTLFENNKNISRFVDEQDLIKEIFSVFEYDDNLNNFILNYMGFICDDFQNYKTMLFEIRDKTGKKIKMDFIRNSNVSTFFQDYDSGDQNAKDELIENFKHFYSDDIAHEDLSLN